MKVALAKIAQTLIKADFFSHLYYHISLPKYEYDMNHK